MYRSVFLHGYYAMSNFGDELFLAVMSRRLLELGVERVSCSNSSIRFMAGFWERVLGYRRAHAAARVLNAVYATLSSDIVIFAGGSVFSRLGGTKNLILRISRFHSVRLLAVGVSIGPFDSNATREKAISAISRCESIVVRDGASVEMLKELPGPHNVACGGDLAALWDYPLLDPNEKSDSAPVVVCPCVNASWTAEEYASVVASALNVLGHREVVVLALNGDGDSGDIALSRSVVEAIASAGTDVRIETFSALGLEGTIAQLCSAEFVISGRLHGAVVAYLASVPFFLIDYHAKCADFAVDIGWPGCHGEVPTTRDIRAIANSSPVVSADQYKRNARSVYGSVFGGLD